MNILAPITDEKTMKKAKVIVLLHGYSGNHNSYLKDTNIFEIAKKNNLIVIMPDADNSFYCNHLDGSNYFDYINDEIFEVASKTLNRNLEKHDMYIIGISMGGYGALSIGLQTPNRFKGIGSISGSVDIMSRDVDKRINESELAEEWKAMFGKKISSKNDIFLKLKNAPLPKLYLCCGDDDYLLSYNLKLIKKLKKLKIEHTYEQDPGEHNWDYFSQHLETALTELVGVEC
ncbi:MAG: prolyl oligopeptidase family serine peptidase [Spiroplasma sp.]|nr:prolyl oligopeptidase family serine peptidase [Mycoplasmatales bacterium]